MKHLVPPLKDLTLVDGLAALKQAHSFITGQVTTELAFKMKSATKESGSWGCDFKRIDILLPKEHPHRSFTDSANVVHTLIGESVCRQKLVEIINQAATMERLIDAVSWALSNDSGLKEYKIQLCHPTTSSEVNTKKNQSDHDLVLSGSDGRRAVFEVSDVASSSDGNKKRVKDLRSLGLLASGTKEEAFRVQQWPIGRFFLVVSHEWKKPLNAKRQIWAIDRVVGTQAIPPHLSLKPVDWPSSTGIFEIHPGLGFGKSPLCTPL